MRSEVKLAHLRRQKPLFAKKSWDLSGGRCAYASAAALPAQSSKSLPELSEYTQTAPPGSTLAPLGAMVTKYPFASCTKMVSSLTYKSINQGIGRKPTNYLRKTRQHLTLHQRQREATKLCLASLQRRISNDSFRLSWLSFRLDLDRTPGRGPDKVMGPRPSKQKYGSVVLRGVELIGIGAASGADGRRIDTSLNRIA